MKKKFKFKYIRACVVVLMLMFSADVYAGNLFTGKPNDKGIRLFLEPSIGYSHYSSPGGLYKMNQSVFHATGIIGYEFNSFLIGLGGTASRYNRDHLYSFKSFLNARYIFKNLSLHPYCEVLGGVVGYLKWNDFVKPYYGFGAGVHVLPRVCTGLRVANVGMLDNTNSWEYSISVSFVIGK